MAFAALNGNGVVRALVGKLLKCIRRCAVGISLISCPWLAWRTVAVFFHNGLHKHHGDRSRCWHAGCMGSVYAHYSVRLEHRARCAPHLCMACNTMRGSVAMPCSPCRAHNSSDEVVHVPTRSTSLRKIFLSGGLIVVVMGVPSASRVGMMQVSDVFW